jgi:hypothetical protein
MMSSTPIPSRSNRLLDILRFRTGPIDKSLFLLLESTGSTDSLLDGNPVLADEEETVAALPADLVDAII